MTVKVVTGVSKEGFELYGRMCLDSFEEFWPTEVELLVYAEEHIKLPVGELVMAPPGLTAFLHRWEHNVVARGEKVLPGHSWKAKDRERGYNFRYDAVKFCKMAFYTAHAARGMKSGILVWMDADVLTHQKVPKNFVEDLLGDDDYLYLGRAPYHPDAAFTAFRIPQARPIATSWADYYDSDEVFELKEWHSAYVLDQCRRHYEKRGVKCHDLTPGGKKHVWFQSPLGEYTDHLKGKRKYKGRSDERL